MSLREELARRIARIEVSSLPEVIRASLYGASDEYPPAAFLGSVHRAVADECIRQMEWACREGRERMCDAQDYGDPDECSCDVREYGSHALNCPRRQPSLAPKDWKP